MHKEIGKIESITFGLGGYDDAMIGFRIVLGGKNWGTQDFWGSAWSHVSEEQLLDPKSSYRWTHESRIKNIGEGGWKIWTLMKEAGVEKMEDLKDKPIEATFEGACGKLISFRILSEVL